VTRQLGPESLGRTARTRQLEKTAGMVQDDQNMTEGQGSWDRTNEMGQPRKDSRDSNVGA
jgi:hypothetical protein